MGYDALWGGKGPTMSSLKDSHLKYALEGITDRESTRSESIIIYESLAVGLL